MSQITTPSSLLMTLDPEPAGLRCVTLRRPRSYPLLPAAGVRVRDIAGDAASPHLGTPGIRDETLEDKPPRRCVVFSDAVRAGLSKAHGRKPRDAACIGYSAECRPRQEMRRQRRRLGGPLMRMIVSAPISVRVVSSVIETVGLPGRRPGEQLAGQFTERLSASHPTGSLTRGNATCLRLCTVGANIKSLRRYGTGCQAMDRWEGCLDGR